MPRLPGNKQLTDAAGNHLHTLRDINALAEGEKERIYGSILPVRLFKQFSISPHTFRGNDGQRKVRFVAPCDLGFCRVEVRLRHNDRDRIFFLEIADSQYNQMELAFCVIKDPASPRFDVDRNLDGSDNYFATMGRNISEEIRAMRAGLYPNQTQHGLRMFPEFFQLFERFVDALGMDIIMAEPLTYDNAIRYEKIGFDYLTGKKMMLEINEGFRPGNYLHKRLDGSSPFRMPGMEKTVRGRSWAIHDGIMGIPWDGIVIYKTVGEHTGVDTFPEKEPE